MDGDPAAAQRLWELYIRRLIGFARAKLRSFPLSVADPEDVALSAFASFADGAQRGEFPRLHDRNDLWRILLTITSNKSKNLIEYLCAARRDVRRTEALGDVEQELTTGPSSATFEAIDRGCSELLDKLQDEKLRKVAIAKLENRSNREIAELLCVSSQTIGRKLQAIAKIWTNARVQIQ